MIFVLKTLLLIGFLLSLYAVRVEQRLREKNFTALCDINEQISCSKAFSSSYGHLLFGISNSILGSFFYAGMYALLLLQQHLLFFLGAVFSVIGSVYLAYRSYITLKTYCLVCTSIYLVNILLLAFSYLLAKPALLALF